MNVVTVVGNLTRDPELFRSEKDTSIARCGVAVRRDRKEKNGEYGVDFFDVVAWGSQAEFIVKNCRKGTKVCVNGSVHLRDWIDKNGAKRTNVEIHVANLENLTPKDAPTQDAPEQPKAEPQPVAEKGNVESIDVTDDDLPF